MNFYPKSISAESSLTFRVRSSVLFFLRHLFNQSDMIRTREKALVEKEVERLKGKGFGKVLPVDRRENLSEEEFIRSYFKKSLPVVFSGQALNWGCTKKWNFDFLENELDGVYFDLSDSSGLNDLDQAPESLLEKKVISAQELARSVKRGDKWYLRFSTILDQNKNLLRDLDHHWLKRMRRCLMGVCYQNFIGAKGRKTPLHSESTALFYVMVHGEKKWTMTSAKSTAFLSPQTIDRSYFSSRTDLTNLNSKEFPSLDHLTIFECDLKEGDILFVPAWMWHQVENLTDSWGLSYSYTSIESFSKHPALALTRVLFGKPSFIRTLLSAFFPSLHVSPDAPQIIRD